MTDKRLQKAIDATSSLLRFCEEHGYEHEEMIYLRGCFQCFNENNQGCAMKNYREVSIGGMGCFNDWSPYEIKTSYSQGTARNEFHHLVKEWNNAMHTLTTPDMELKKKKWLEERKKNLGY